VKPYALATWAVVLLTVACSGPKVITTETITIRETQTVRDTVTLRDSITLVQDRVQVEIVRLPGDRIYVKGTCKGDTVFSNTQTIREVNKKPTRRQELFTMLPIIVLGITLLVVILKK
jgi:hypothetical protein